MTTIPSHVTPQTAPAGERLTLMYERRKALSATIDTELAQTGEMTPERESRIYAQMQECDDLDARIRVQALRDERSGGGIVLGTGRPVQEQRDAFTEWATRGYRTGGYELRATTVSSLGNATDVASSEFIAAMARDSVIAAQARTVVVDTLAPVVYYRQSAQMALVGAIAEAAAATSRDVAAAKVTLSPQKTSIYTDVSLETLSTMPFDVASDLQQQHGELHAATWEAAFGGATALTNCQAISEALGTFTSIVVPITGLITVSSGLTAMYGSGLKSGYLTGAIWLLSPTMWAATAGQAGTNVYAFGGGQGDNVARHGVGATFLGHPVITSSGMPAVGANARAGIFGNVRRGYRIHRYSGVQFQADPYTVAVNGQVRYTSLVFHDAAIVDTNAMVAVACAAS